MELTDAVVVVTGGGSGIGAALAERLAAAGAAVVVVADLHAEHAAEVAAHVAATATGTQVLPAAVDVADEAAVVALIEQVQRAHGTIDLFCANAGIGSAMGLDAPDEVWRRVMDVNVMAHLYAARALVPTWCERGRGHLLVTASAAGLLTNLGDAPYSVSKHAAVALAEWISITYGHRGVGVSCLCPQGVRTPLLFGDGDGALATEVVKSQRILEPEQVAEVTVAALARDQFLILPHEEVATYEQARAGDRERWLGSMRRLQARIDGA